MRSLLPPLALVFLMALPANAATITFSTDPFAGTDVLTTPGRQIVGMELFTDFDPTVDLLEFDETTFGVSSIDFFSSVAPGAADVPASGVNTIALVDVPDPFAAGIAASLIAAQIADPGPGFFLYFNTGLNLPRLVFSTDLSDPTADLKILARFTNLLGNPGAMATFSAANFAITQVPEPASALLLVTAGALVTRRAMRRRRGN